MESCWQPFLPPTPFEGHIIPLNLPIYPYCLAISVIALNENWIYPIPGYKRFSFSVQGPDYPIASLTARPRFTRNYRIVITIVFTRGPVVNVPTALPRHHRHCVICVIDFAVPSVSPRHWCHRFHRAIGDTVPSVSPLSPRHWRHSAIGVTAFTTSSASPRHQRYRAIRLSWEARLIPRFIYRLAKWRAANNHLIPQMRSTNARTRVAK